eukprot:713787-Prymnesium_polylepis.1
MSTFLRILYASSVVWPSDGKRRLRSPRKRESTASTCGARRPDAWAGDGVGRERERAVRWET